ncbi:MAG: hypothetical protein ACTSPW_12470 [Promethearchaeota archaeon]
MVVGKTSFSNTNVSFISGTGWRIRIWLSNPAFDGYGPFTIRIDMNKTNYYNSTELLNIRVIGLTNLELINLTQYNQLVRLNDSVYEAFLGDNITIYADFRNVMLNSLISGALGNVSFNGKNYINTTDDNGIYSWEINTSSLSAGRYSFTLTFNKTYYYNKSIVIWFDLNIIHTNITIDSVFDGSGELGYSGTDYRTYTSKGTTNVTVIITFWDENHSIPIDTTILGNLTVTSNGQFIERLFNETDGNGVAWFTLNSSNYAQEKEYLINITFWQPNYYQAWCAFNLSIVKWLTNATILAVNQTGGKTTVEFDGTHYIVYRGYNTTFLVLYQNKENSSYISGAEVTFLFTNYSGSVNFNNVNYTNAIGRCRFYIPTHNMTTGIFGFTITFAKEDHTTQILNGRLKIVFIPTNGSLVNVTQISHSSGISVNLTYVASNNTYIGYMLENITVRFSYGDILNNVWINDGNFTLLFNGIWYWNATGINGIYSITMPTENLNGTFVIQIIMKKFNYANVSYSFNLTIKPLPTSLTVIDISPDKQGIFDSDDVFNITVFYNDTMKNTGLDNLGSAKIYYSINGSSYQLGLIFNGTSGYYYLQINCSEFLNWGKIKIVMIATLFGYENATAEYNFIINGLTKLIITDPASGINQISNQNFTITIYFNDTIKNAGITSAYISYSVDGGNNFGTDRITDVGNGYYTIIIRNSDVVGFGSINIIINASMKYYINQSVIYQYFLYNQTSQSIVAQYLHVIRGENATFSVYYNWSDGTPITGGNITDIQINPNFKWWMKEIGNGRYDLILNTLNVSGGATYYTIIFNISKDYNQTQQYTVYLQIWNRTTYLINSLNQTNYSHYLSSAPSWFGYYGEDITFNISYLDTDNGNNLITGANANLTIYNATGTLYSTQIFGDTGGYYYITLKTANFFVGNYNVKVILNTSLYNRTIDIFTLEIRACKISFNIINFTQVNTIVVNPFYGENMTVYVNLINAFTHAIISGGIGNLSFNGKDYIYTDNDGDGIYVFENINISKLPVGNYSFLLSFSRKNYQNYTFVVNFSINKIILKLEIVEAPTEVNPGEDFKLSLKITNKLTGNPIEGINVKIKVDFGSGLFYEETLKTSQLAPKTSATGLVSFTVPVPENAEKCDISIQCLGTDTIGDFNYNFELNIKEKEEGAKPPEVPFDPIMLIIIIIAVVLGIVIGIAVGWKKGKEEKIGKKEAFSEVKTIFDDAVNLEHIFVLYKGTGTCIFFKSFSSEAIDPELISELLSVVASFGRETESTQALNQISYGDKILLLADGKYIRVALVLSKEASAMLRKHLKDFITKFEKAYKNELSKWSGQLNVFQDAGVIVDETLNTSIILPHKLSFDYCSPKSVKDPNAREVLKIAQEICKETERDFFFIATLLQEVVEKTGMDTAEIFMGIKELRDKKVFIPIDISTIEEQPISQQEIDLLRQKLAEIPSISEEQKESILQDLIKMSSVEREAYLASLLGQQEIISAPIKEVEEAGEITDIKSAKKEIKILEKEAEKAKKNKNYEEAIKIFEKAAIIASNWDLTKILYELEDKVRLTNIEIYKEKIKQLEKDAKSAAEEGDYGNAANKYNVAAELANEIFKLGGGGDMYKEVKRLKNKAIEYEKMK